MVGRVEHKDDANYVKLCVMLYWASGTSEEDIGMKSFELFYDDAHFRNSVRMNIVLANIVMVIMFYFTNYYKPIDRNCF